jgi:hypothetical protein
LSYTQFVSGKRQIHRSDRVRTNTIGHDDSLMTRVLQLAESMIAKTPLDNWLTEEALHAPHRGTELSARALDLETRAVILSPLPTRRTTKSHRRTPVTGRRRS